MKKMKPMISCKKCASMRASYFVEEWYKLVEGIAKEDMLCDWCDTKILKGVRCVKESLISPVRGKKQKER